MQPENTFLLYTDIVGYTALLRADKSNARTQLDKFKAILEEQVENSNGNIAQHQRDSILATFTDLTDAITCAEAIHSELQSEQALSVRIGIHQGELEIRDEQAFGEGVLEVTQLERIGVAGSVVISQKVQSQLPSNERFPTQSLGEFQFRKVEKPMEVFALTSAGLTIPDIKHEEADKSRRQRWSRAIKVFAGYLVASWTFLQFVDWALTRYQVSPYWTDILLWTFVGIIPSLLIYLVHQERINQRKFLRREKILIPLNLLLLFGGLTVAYGKSDLGSITKNINYTSVNGQAVAKHVIKDEFKTSIAIFPFEQERGADTTLWLEKAISASLTSDLFTDKYLNSRAFLDTEMVDKINSAKLYGSKYFVDGSYQIDEKGFAIKSSVRNARNGKIIQEKTFSGDNFFTLIDSISIYLRQSVGLSPTQMEESVDLDFSSFVTDDFKAFQYFSVGLNNRDWGSFEKAIELDSTFALAMVVYATGLFQSNQGRLEATLLVEKAMLHRKKLPEQQQFALLVVNYILQGDYDKAEKLIYIQLEQAPNDPFMLQNLSILYKVSGELDKLKAINEKLFKGNPNPIFYINAIQAALMNGKAKQVEKDLLVLLEEFPQNPSMLDLLMDAYLLQQKYDQAQETVEELLLMNPNFEPTKTKLLDAIQYLKNNPIPEEWLAKLQGDYRSDGSEKITTLKFLNNSLLYTSSGTNGYFTYPISDSSLVRGFSNFVNEIVPLANDSEDVYGFLLKQENLDGRKGNYYYWKQDSLIWQAEELLKNRNYEEALPVYEAAIAKYPEHYYLYKAKEHVEFMLSKTEEEIENIYLRYVSEYSEGLQVWMEKGQLFFKFPKRSRIILRPISDHEFIELSDYNGIYIFEKEDEEVKGIYGKIYHKELKEWHPYEGWYQARVKMKD